MGIYEELVARGLIAQVTNEEEIREMINNGKATFYIGFDCTADSLTAGHFMHTHTGGARQFDLGAEQTTKQWGVPRGG